jgi:hypothetical protein
MLIFILASSCAELNNSPQRAERIPSSYFLFRVWRFVHRSFPPSLSLSLSLSLSRSCPERGIEKEINHAYVGPIRSDTTESEMNFRHLSFARERDREITPVFG